MIELLRSGAITVLGRHPYASNNAYVVQCETETASCRALYKPVAGERALWDFPDTALAAREVAAFAVAEALDLQCIPETVWRDDAPAGPGSLQRWIDDASIEDVAVLTDYDDSWLHVFEAQLTDGTDVHVVHRDSEELRAIAFLDVLLNNADRKAGHLLRGPDGHLWGVDHGVTFHAEPKLRTVLWGFVGQTIADELLARLSVPLHELPEVASVLNEAELAALQDRMQALLRTRVYPEPSPDWPAVPWPVF